MLETEAAKPDMFSMRHDVTSWGGEMEAGQESVTKRVDDSSQTPDLPRLEAPSRRQSAAWLLLCAILVGAGLYILANYLRALAWALILAVALWPFYERVRRQTSPALAKEILPILFTAAVGSAVIVPLATLTVEAIREFREIVAYGRSLEESGIPVPDFVARLPYGGQWATDWWHEHLSHAGWAKEILRQVNTSSVRELGANLGANAVHRAVLFGMCLLTLFFLFRSGENLSRQCKTASQRLFGERGERIALQMAASVHGTVNGLVFVAIGEGILLGAVYFFTKVPHPILFGVATAIAAMIPFAAGLAVGLAALVLLGSGGVGPAIVVVVAGFAVIFLADHFVRPKLIGGATQLPFLWVLLGILGGVESFQLLGLFLGPAIMAALMLLWRELAAPPTGADRNAGDAGAEPHRSTA
jgi:predicted PurR-regulated permease PerM